MEKTLKELAELTGGEPRGPETLTLSGVAGLDEAGEKEITFLANIKYADKLGTTRAAAVIVSAEAAAGAPAGKALLVVDDPYLAFARILTLFHPLRRPAAGVSDEAFVAEGASVGDGASVGPFAWVGRGACIGARTILHPGAYVGDGASVGEDCLIYPNVSIREGCIVGDRVILHCGVVIGSDGFGFARDGHRHFKVPQIGIVRIGNDVEIGANTTVDRGTMGETVIEGGAKIDNLVQIAHNVRIGAGSILVAQVGISGSTRLGKGVVLGGQVGLVGHIELGDGVMVGAKSGVNHDLPAGVVVSGYPAIPHRDWLRASVVAGNLPDLRRTVRRLEREVRELKEALGDQGAETRDQGSGIRD